MSRYFTITQGLRGCYMPDSCYVVRVDTRRELKEALESEARDIRDAGFLGLSKPAVAALAATLWRRANARKAGKPDSIYDSVAPYRRAGQPGNWAFGLFGSPASRSEYLESLESEAF